MSKSFVFGSHFKFPVTFPSPSTIFGRYPLRSQVKMVASLLVAALVVRLLVVNASPAYIPRSALGNQEKGGDGYDDKLISDISCISKNWGQLSTYHDNPDNRFGVKDVGVPDGCQIVQAHTLQRHAQRFPTSAFDDGKNDENFAARLANFTQANPSARFTGSLDFLNEYEYLLTEDYLTGNGATTEFDRGVSFWNRYGRLIYQATRGQLHYNASNDDGSPRKKPVLRTTSQARIQNSQINWSLGFFGPSYQTIADTELSAVASPEDRAYDLVIIPEGGTENNTLASYDSCFRSVDKEGTGNLGDFDIYQYIAIYLKDANSRMQKYAPSGFTFSLNDTYAMQSICAYEHAFLGDSDFCGLFTADEWAGFEQTLDIEYYYDYAYGNPTGRAQGLGYLQELLARLKHVYIPVSHSSVNSTITQDEEHFPLDQPIYADFSHDDIIISVLTAMSVDYFRDGPSLSVYPPDPKRRFILSDLTPFGANLVTEVIACNSPNPPAKSKARTFYRQGYNGYEAAKVTNKFVRMRLNNGIIPLDSIRGGACAKRTDGLCELGDFFESQKDAEKVAKYAEACFGDYKITDKTNGKDYDGTVPA